MDNMSVAVAANACRLPQTPSVIYIVSFRVEVTEEDIWT